MEKIKVFLSDSQVLFREGIHFTLSGEDDFEVTGESVNNEEALSGVEANPPNVVILSMKSARLDGPAATRRIKRNLPSVSVILVLDSDRKDELFPALKSGASAVITKDTDPNYLLDMLRVIAQGSQPIIDSLLEPGIAEHILAEFEDLSTLSEQLDHLLATLSPKETEVLQTIAGGSNLEQTIAKLNSNEATVRRHLKSILNKLINNEQSRAIIEAAQRSLPTLLTARSLDGKLNKEYVTRDEFAEFKESLMERLKSFIGGLSEKENDRSSLGNGGGKHEVPANIKSAGKRDKPHPES